MNVSEIIQAFGSEPELETTVTSLSSYAPVFRFTTAAGIWVMKRTQRPFVHANALMSWTRSLAAQGVPVVTPAPGFGENPRSIPDEAGEEQSWVIYPFIEGETYLGDPAHIRAAGELLGKIHAAGMEAEFGLKQSNTIPVVDPEELEQDRDIILQFIEQYFPGSLEQAGRILQERIGRYIEQVCPRMSAEHPPLTNATWDYKAVNLVFTSSGPVLVDPDNGGRIPRAYDVAIAALLFHNDGVEPGRVLTPEEWRVFLDGYRSHVQLSEIERRLWPDILLCAWIDEAVWLLMDDASGWADPKQSTMLHSLLLVDLADFELI